MCLTNTGYNYNVSNLQTNVVAEGNTFDRTDGSTRLGDGTSGNPYQISTYADLVAVATSVNSGEYTSYQSKYYKLMNDISDNDGTSTATWTPIGSRSTTNYVFKGSFDGNGHTITFTKNVTINNTSGNAYDGVFGYVQGTSSTNKATIQNLGVNWKGGLSVIASTNVCVGGIVGSAEHTSITKCYSAGNINITSSSYVYAGGVAGEWTYSSTISNCYNTGSIKATSSAYVYVGGIVGAGSVSNNTLTINNCYNIGNVMAISTTPFNESRAGGVVGAICFSGMATVYISNCYNTGSLSATSLGVVYAYGIVGFATSATNIFNCFSIGTAPSANGSTKNVGGIAGYSGTIQKCYHNYGKSYGNTTDKTIFKSNLASLVKTSDNFTSNNGQLSWYDGGSYSYDCAWNFTNIWMTGPSEVVNGVTVGINFGYPIFQWQWNGTEITPSTSLSGSGTQDEPYLIEDAQDLKCLSRTTSYWTGGKYFKQTADITYTDVWSPIGTSSSSAFEGNYDGGGFEIAFTQIITIENTLGDAYGGLFGYAKNGTIENLGVDWETGLNAISSNTTYAGGVAGFVYYYKSYKTIKYCYNKGVINATSNASSGKTYVGGIIGYLHYAGGATIGGSTSTPGGVSPVPPPLATLTIVKCYNEGMVSVESTGNAYVGGITGFVLNMRINNCYNSGAVSAKSISDTAYAGGILGDSTTGLTEINNCYNIGNVSATLLPTSSSPYAGGINAKYYRIMEVNNCFYLENCVSFVGDGEMNTSGTSLSLVDMQNTSIYIGWDFTNIWGIDTSANTNGGLPYLKWFEEYHITYIVPDESTNKEKTIYYGLKSIVSSFTAQISSIEEIGLTIPSGKEFIHWVDDNGNTYNVGDNKIFTNNKVLTAICLEYISFNITTNVGVIFNICDNENNILQSIYVSAGSSFADNSPTFVYQAQGNQTYKVMISAPYTSNIQHTRVNGQQELVGRVLTLMVGSDKFTVEMDITGYLGGNSIVV